ncbi:MAG TPA: NADPH-dependent FMN reductase [Caulobacteraceae bacterium]|nr:NADPH-dependent FMN reductase [Caulobacteraceae bacterium]
MNGARPPFIVGIGGTVRSGSTSETALARALGFAADAGARTELFGGAFLASLPIYNPSAPERFADLERFVEAVRLADGVIIATPGYHGSISGLVKNALDCLEWLKEDERPYLDGRAAGCIVAASGHQACGSALASLRAIVHALRGWPTPFGATLNTGVGLFSEDGAFLDPRDSWQVETVAAQVVAFAAAWSG